MVAGFHTGEKRCRDRGHTGGKHRSGLRLFRRRERFFRGGVVRVGHAGVDIVSVRLFVGAVERGNIVKGKDRGHINGQNLGNGDGFVQLFGKIDPAGVDRTGSDIKFIHDFHLSIL